jgi:transcriptional regulator with XRE-family HTH domain
MTRPRALPIDKIVGENIQKRRVALGMTQQDLADEINVTYQQIHKYETGKNRIACSRLYMIAMALKWHDNSGHALINPLFARAPRFNIKPQTPLVTFTEACSQVRNNKVLLALNTLMTRMVEGYHDRS